MSAPNSESPSHGLKQQDDKPCVFDAIVGFDAVIFDLSTGDMKAELVPEIATAAVPTGCTRAGHLAMGGAIDFKIFGVDQ